MDSNLLPGETLQHTETVSYRKLFDTTSLSYDIQLTDKRLIVKESVTRFGSSALGGANVTMHRSLEDINGIQLGQVHSPFWLVVAVVFGILFFWPLPLFFSLVAERAYDLPLIGGIDAIEMLLPILLCLGLYVYFRRSGQAHSWLWLGAAVLFAASWLVDIGLLYRIISYILPALFVVLYVLSRKESLTVYGDPKIEIPLRGLGSVASLIDVIEEVRQQRLHVLNSVESTPPQSPSPHPTDSHQVGTTETSGAPPGADLLEDDDA